MAKTTDTSVLANLKDLFEMETDRRVEEAAATERAKAAEAARAEAERRAREEAIEAARGEERRRAAEREAERGAEIERRIETLRAQLDEVRTAREQMRLEIAAMANRPEAPRTSRMSWIAGGMAAVSLIAAIAATAVAWPQNAPAVAQADVPVQVEEAIAEAPEMPEPVVEEAPPVEAPVVVAEAEPEPETRRTRDPRPHRPRQPSVSDLDTLDFGDDDAVLSDEFLRHADR